MIDTRDAPRGTHLNLSNRIIIDPVGKRRIGRDASGALYLGQDRAEVRHSDDVAAGMLGCKCGDVGGDTVSSGS